MSTITLDRPARTTPRTTPRARATQSATELRLTRRGRLVVLLVSLAVVLAVGLLVAAGSVASPEPAVPAPSRLVVVGPGDTLWDIAADAAASAGTDDVREAMTTITELNELDSSSLQAGQQLLVPLG